MLSPKLFEDTQWLTKKMCGIENEVIPQETADYIVCRVHECLPKDYPTVKNYKIDRCEMINTGTGRGNSKR